MITCSRVPGRCTLPDFTAPAVAITVPEREWVYS